MPPPPAPPPKSGLSGAQIALIVVVAVLVLGGGCTTCLCLALARSASNSVKPVVEQPSRTPAPSQPSKDSEWITATRPYVKFHAPVGWSTEITQNKEWGIFKSPARDAAFAFTTFNQPGESTTRLGKAASVLGVSDIDWRSPRAGTVGRDHFFNARVADGSCNFKGPGGYIWYATVDSGSSDQILLIFAVSASAPPARRAEAQAAIDSLQRR